MNIKVVCVVILIAVGFSACTQETIEQQLSQADNWLKEGDKRAAILVLKNAAQAAPVNSEIRFKLGKIYLSTGLAAQAEKELKLALKQGYETNIVIPLIAKSLILQFKNTELIEFVNNSKGLSLEAMTTLYTLQAQAYFALNDVESANQSIFNANELSAESPYARLGSAYGAFNKKEIALALDTVDQLLQQYPEFTEALLLKGQLESSKSNFKAALTSFEKYHQLKPDLFQGRVYLADGYIRNNQLKEAERHVDILLSVNKNSPFINQLKAQIKYHYNDYEAAKLYAENANTYGGENQVTNTIAAVSAYQLGLNEQAYTHLSKSIDKLPKNHQLHGLYQVLKLKLGYASNEHLDQETLIGLKENHQDLLIESGLALTQKGKLEEANTFLEIIDSSKIEDPAELTRLSMLKLALNDKTAYLDLEKVLHESPGDINAQTILANVYSAEGKIKEALLAADAIIKHHPKKVDGFNLKGMIYANNKQLNEAEKQYQKALDIESKDIPANIFFGKLAIQQKNEVKALEIFKRIINFKPIHLPSLITYFALEHKVGAPEEAIKPIQEAYNLEPSNIKYALHYAKLLEVSKEYDQAISILKQITVSKTTPAPYWRLLIDIYLKQSKPQKVEDSLIQWTSTNPETGVAWRYLANLYESQGNVNKALTQVKSGIKFAKTERDNLLVLEIQHLIYLNKIKEGRESLNLLANQYEADNPVINLLEGQLFTLENKCKQALPLLENNYHFKPSVKVLKLVLNCNVKLNHIEEAVTFTKNHLKSFPKDNTARLYLAGLVMKNDKPYAEEIYKRILETDELNRIALNNLAAVMQEQGRSSEAVEITSNALKLAPDEPYLLEIHASALLKNNQTDEAISAYAKAYNASNKSKKYAQFYVDALRKTGNEAVANKISQDAGI